MKTFLLPDVGEGLQEAEIVSWHVAAGDHVVADQPLLAIETDKAVVEVPSPQSGRIENLLAKAGDRVEVGAPLVEFEQGEHQDAGAVVGTIKTADEKSETNAKRSPAQSVKVTPAVRAIASKLGVDLAIVQGTGVQGSITSGDVERAAATLANAAEAEAVTGVRRAMAERMSAAHSEVVTATVIEEADIESWKPDTALMLRLIRAVACACKAQPDLNAWFDGKAMTRRLHEVVDLGIAVNTADGLFVPVLRDVGNRNAEDIAQALERLKSDVKNRSIPAAELRGQTITLSNFGAITGRFANLVVVPPQVAILGAGKARQRAVVVNGELQARRVLPLSLSFDHRAVTGGEAAAFLAAVIEDIERSE